MILNLLKMYNYNSYLFYKKNRLFLAFHLSLLLKINLYQFFKEKLHFLELLNL